MDSDGMLDWSASECKDYKDCIMATLHVHVQTPQLSSVIHGSGVDLLSSQSTSPDAKMPLYTAGKV